MARKTRPRRRIYGGVALLVAWCAVAWFIARQDYLDHARADVAYSTAEAEADVRALANNVALNLGIMRGIPELVGELPSVREAVSQSATLRDGSALSYPARKQRWTRDATLNLASRMLDTVNASVNGDAVYVLDVSGRCVASSDWGTPASRVGKDYSRYLRFVQGMHGSEGVEYAFDPGRNAPALSFSAPIVVNGRTKGVAVLTVEMPSLLFMIGATDSYVTDRQGVIVVAQDPALQMRVLSGASVSALSQAQREALYGKSPLLPLRVRTGGGAGLPEVFRYEGRDAHYLVVSRELPVYGLTVHIRKHLAELTEFRRNQIWFAVLIAALGAIVILGTSFVATHIEFLATGKAVLAESEARFRGLIEQSITGIYVSQNDKIVYANPRMCEIVGWPLDEIVGRDSTEFFSGNSAGAQTVRDARARLARGERSVSLVAPFTRKDGKTINIGIHAALGLWDGRPAAFVIAADITERERHETMLAEYVRQLEESMAGTLQAVSNMVEQRDPYTAGHERRVGIISGAIAAQMGWPAERCRKLELIGLVHDIGKIAVPVEILTKPGRLTAFEYDLVKLHAERGYEVLKDVKFPLPIADIIRQHHERMDGSGYPQGLKGEDILPEARILAVADVVESMASHRPYRPAVGLEAALHEIESHKGTLYDAAVVDALLTLIRDQGYQLPP